MRCNMLTDAQTVNFPLVMGSHDKTFEGGVHKNWPPVPWVVLLVMKLFYFGKHADRWKFLPCDFNGKPKDLPFAV